MADVIRFLSRLMAVAAFFGTAYYLYREHYNTGAGCVLFVALLLTLACTPAL